MPSFDAYLNINWHEVTNAVDQVKREIATRYDFKGSKSEVDFDKEKSEISILADDDLKLRALQDIIKQKLAKRGVSLNLCEFKDSEKAAISMLRQKVVIKGALSTEDLKSLNKSISAAKFKVTSQIQGEQLRVTGKNKDDLQSVMAHLKQNFTTLDLQFGNFRD